MNPKYSHLYQNTRWKKLAKHYLDKNPLCVPCLSAGKTTAATIVHHITEHKGDCQLFWNEDNFQAVCASCHSGHIRVGEHQGYSQSADENGIPLDKNHPWNKKE
jgi:5-methylcytosine-specific restriction endonuclease McrA